MAILKIFARSEADRKLKTLVESSYTSLKVVGRGTIHIDPEEVRKTEEFKAARAAAKKIVAS